MYKSMNEQMQKYSEELIEWVKLAAQDATKLVHQELPLFIQEYLSWYFYSNLLWAILGTVFLLTSLILFFKNLKAHSYVFEKDRLDAGETAKLLTIIVLGFFTIISSFNFGITTLGNIRDCLKVKIAPRLVLAEFAKKITK